MHLSSKKIIFFFLLLCATFFYACKEIGPSIDFTPVDETLADTTYQTDSVFAVQSRVVLMEDFTGQECVNCPAAHEVIAELIVSHGDAVAALALYNYSLDVDEGLPYVTAEAEELFDYLGGFGAWPIGAVNRKNFGSGVLIPKDQYTSNTEAELLLAPKCNVQVKNTYDDVTRKLITTVIVQYTAAVAEINHVSVAVCENGIIDFQVGPGGEIPDYVHNHVLRKMLTLATGTELSESNIAGRVYIKQFAITLPDDWVKENLDVIAYVHNYETDNKEILQTAIMHLD